MFAKGLAELFKWIRGYFRFLEYNRKNVYFVDESSSITCQKSIETGHTESAPHYASVKSFAVKIAYSVPESLSEENKPFISSALLNVNSLLTNVGLTCSCLA